MALVQISETPRWKKLLGFVGPGFLVSVAYLDPGNLETDLQAGANNKYQLLWIILVGLSFALIIQSRSANLGVATGITVIHRWRWSYIMTLTNYLHKITWKEDKTGEGISYKLFASESFICTNNSCEVVKWNQDFYLGKHLSEHCKAEYPKLVNYCLWILAEVSVIAADVPEVIGTAFALNILFGLPIWAGVLLAGLNTLLLLALQRYGIRKLEVTITVLLLIMGGCFFADMAHAKPNAAEVLMGMFVPKLRSVQATRDAIALLGALIMPHNLFLHSALVLSRKIPRSVHGINSACRCFLIESGVALLITFLINVSVVSVSGSVCSDHDLSSSNKARCKNITLNSAAFLLKNVLGKWSSTVYAISLLASGQSSAVAGTYAGQYIMQGFLDLKMRPWLRNLLTRCIAITPSLVVTIIGGSSGAGRLIIIVSMILSFQLPFALVPLIKFTSNKNKMGLHRNSLLVTAASWVLGLFLIGINMYYVSMSLSGWLTHPHLPRATSVLAAAIVIPGVIFYIGMLVYLTFKKETAVTCSPPVVMNVVRSDQAQLWTEPNIDSRTDPELQVEIVCSNAQASSLNRVHDTPLN